MQCSCSLKCKICITEFEKILQPYNPRIFWVLGASALRSVLFLAWNHTCFLWVFLHTGILTSKNKTFHLQLWNRKSVLVEPRMYFQYICLALCQIMKFCDLNRILYAPEFERSDGGGEERKKNPWQSTAVYHQIPDISYYSLLFLFSELSVLTVELFHGFVHLKPSALSSRPLFCHGLSHTVFGAYIIGGFVTQRVTSIIQFPLLSVFVNPGRYLECCLVCQ